MCVSLSSWQADSFQTTELTCFRWWICLSLPVLVTQLFDFIGHSLNTLFPALGNGQIYRHVYFLWKVYNIYIYIYLPTMIRTPCGFHAGDHPKIEEFWPQLGACFRNPIVSYSDWEMVYVPLVASWCTPGDERSWSYFTMGRPTSIS